MRKPISFISPLWRRRRYIRYKNSRLRYHGFQFFTLSDKLVVQNSRERVDFKQQILALLLGHHSQLVAHKICSHFAISWGFLYLLKHSRSLPHKAFHDDKTNLQSSYKKTTGATIGYNVSVANNNLRYNLRLPCRKKRKSVLISNADCSASAYLTDPFFS